MKVVSIVGARPQFIKLDVVSRKIRQNGIDEKIVHTGQHYDFELSGTFFQELKTPEPDYFLGIGSYSHGEQTGKMMIELDKVLLKENPDVVMVYGDTNSVLAGALCSVKLHFPVAHVEAGVRTYNKSIPEEINRVVADHVSNVLFAPTITAVENLKREGILQGVFHVGDVMLDIALEKSKGLDEKGVLSKFGLKEKGYILTTIHRAENTDVKANLENIWNALLFLADDGKKVFFPMHPRSSKALKDYDFFNCHLPPNLIISKPVSYKEMITLEKNARLIISDSGGVQREAYFFRIPCIIPKKDTSWSELVDAGWNSLSGADKDKIISLANQKWEEGQCDKEWIPFFGDGKASENIAQTISEQF